MIKEFTIIDEAGLHARPASLLSQQASKFPNNIFIEYSGRKMTLKSILIVMSLGIPQGAKIKLYVEGENDSEVMAALEKILVDHQLV